MPFYHFRMAKGPKIIDPNGIDLPDAEAAKRHAEKLADGLTAISAEFSGIRHLLNWRIEVTDQHGKTLAQYEVPHVLGRAAAPNQADLNRRQRSRTLI
jgi:hypothetical protein